MHIDTIDPMKAQITNAGILEKLPYCWRSFKH